MELPKNVTQIGESDRNCKIYVEDYVISYIKQVNQLALNKEMAVALYGVRKTEGNVMYLFIYGACKLDFLYRETRHLSQAQCQEIEKLRKKYFPDYDFQGYRLLNGEMVEGFHVHEQEICRYITGYAQFYEKNDSMLAYMLDVRTEEAAPEYVDQEKYEVVKRRQEERRTQNGEYRESGFRSTEDTEKSREPENGQPEAGMAYEGTVRENTRNTGDRVDRTGRNARAVKTEMKTKENAPSRDLRRMRLSTVAVFAVLCVLGVGALGQGRSLEEWKDAAQHAMSSLTEQKLPDALEAGNQNAIAQEKVSQGEAVQNAENQNVQTSTLIAEDKLAEALQAENVATGSSSNGQASVTETVQGADSASQAGATGTQTGVNGAEQSAAVEQQTGMTSVQQVDSSQSASGTADNQQAGVAQTTQGAVDTQQQEVARTTEETTPSPQADIGQSTAVQEQTATTNDKNTQTASATQEVDGVEDTAAETDATAVATPTSYIVQHGDTLIGISVRNYGTDTMVSEICSLNGISDADDIKVGQKILLP